MGLLSLVLDVGVSGLDVTIASDSSMMTVDLPVVDNVLNVVKRVSAIARGVGACLLAGATRVRR